ncbi:MAG: MFS transporter [Candidatus Rokubacteria bacterium]|nr:MFS transporter [Candidatus Rokubacteria bacterium]
MLTLTSRVSAAASLRRDARTIGLVSVPHALSHFYQLVLPPLFPVFRDELGVPYVALGLIMSVFYSVSAVGQTAAGFVVDRVGARVVMLTGLACVSSAMALASTATAYWMLLPVAVLGGLGNCAFHPAHYALLNAGVSRARLGRAYSVHSLCGNIGWILAPAVIIPLASQLGWRGALLTVGLAGVVAAALLASPTGTLPDHREEAAADAAGAAGSAAGLRILATAPILMAFAYFAFLSMSIVGLKTFGVPAMVVVYGVAVPFAASALTGYLLGNAAGIVAGGALADRVRRHEVVAVAGMGLAALLALVLAAAVAPGGWLPLLMGATGFCMGLTQPSRDLIVRAATPIRAAGKVFGFVYSGLDLGSTVTPLAFGLLLDRGAPRAVFAISAALMVVTALTVLRVRALGGR